MLQRKKLLLVEGDAIVLSALCELLMPDDKFHLTTATSCGDAEFLFKDNHFDLIILNPELLKGRVQNYLDLIGLNGVLAPIIFTGEVQEPLGYIRNAKMIVIPSLWEGLPRVAIEAQALKTPIISSCNEGGLGEILLDGNAGILTIPDDVDDLVNAITLYENDESLASKNAQEGFKNIDRFSLRSSSNKYLKIFSEL